MNDFPPFKSVVILAVLMWAGCKFILWPAWDRQIDDLFAQQEAHRIAQCKAGIVTDDGDCHPLRSRK